MTTATDVLMFDLCELLPLVGKAVACLPQSALAAGASGRDANKGQTDRLVSFPLGHVRLSGSARYRDYTAFINATGREESGSSRNLDVTPSLSCHWLRSGPLPRHHA